MSHAPRTPPSGPFRHALAQFTTGVTIVTTLAADGTPVGMTANSFSSVSLEPPLVLWSVSARAASLDVFRSCERYLVHVLAADQLDLARRFATRGANRFGPSSGTAWLPNGARLPRLEGCVAWFECSHRSQHEEGDHVVLVGRVDAFAVDGGTPLVFHDGRYIRDFSETPLPKALQTPWT
jgi:flavin reductase (DIM6/NTAB) family NADH-FMN oxidoreductase RutF